MSVASLTVLALTVAAVSARHYPFPNTLSPYFQELLDNGSLKYEMRPEHRTAEDFETCDGRMSFYMDSMCSLGGQNCPPTIDKKTEDLCGSRFVGTMARACCRSRAYNVEDTQQMLPKLPMLVRNY